jgi:hypothetical protein
MWSQKNGELGVPSKDRRGGRAIKNARKARTGVGQNDHPVRASKGTLRSIFLMAPPLLSEEGTTGFLEA